MKTYNPAILNLIYAIKVKYPEFVEQSGLGYCANASIVLKEELAKIGIEGKLLYGKYLKDNKAGQEAKAHFSNLIKHFPVSKSFHGRVKSSFVKNGNKVSDKGGHVGVLVGSDIYDVTSAQFGLPIAYPLDQFLGMWADAHVVDITLKPHRTEWSQKVLYSYQVKDTGAVALEGYGAAMGLEESEPDTAITDIIFKLKTKNNNYTVNSGLGYCSEASVALKRELDKIGIDSKLIYGKDLSNNADGNAAKAHLINVIKNYEHGPGFFGKLKAEYIKNGNKATGEIGHMVVLVKDTVYDVTSAQFGLPVVYSFSKFNGMWDLVQDADDLIKSGKAMLMEKVSITPGVIDKHAVSVESLTSIAENIDNVDKLDFHKWFSIQSKQVQSNCRIVSSDELGQDYMLHIDKNTPAKFTPMFSEHAGREEDKTLPRITVAPNLFGCVIGYARCEPDFLFHAYDTSPDFKKDKFRGGYEICQLNFTHCLKPSDVMVSNASESDEHWLVNYNRETREYLPTKIGKCFISEIKYLASSDAAPVATYTLYVELYGRDGIYFSKNIKLYKGFYRITLTIDKKADWGNVNNEKGISVFKISAGEYASAKGLSAAMLSMESITTPKYLNW